MLFSCPLGDHDVREVRALVRHAKLRQVGHFMMGHVIVKPPPIEPGSFYRVAIDHWRIALSGTYGHDGLTIDADEYPLLWSYLHPLPSDLTDVFWAGGGHNSAGAEGPAIHAWAKENLKTLRRLR